MGIEPTGRLTDTAMRPAAIFKLHIHVFYEYFTIIQAVKYNTYCYFTSCDLGTSPQ